jgi:putative ABC transport system permease protein
MIAFTLAGKNVTRKRERSILTIIGVLLAVASFTSLLSVAEGMYYRVDRELNGRNVDIYILPKSALPMPVGPIGTLGYSDDVIAPTVVEKLAGIPEFKSVMGVDRIQVVTEGQILTVWGIEGEKFNAFFPHFQISQGRMFQGDLEMVAGAAIAQAKGLAEGKTFSMRDRTFTVAGVGAPVGYFQDYFCFVPVKTALASHNAAGYQEAWIQLNEPGARAIAAQALREKYPDLSVKTREDYLGAVNDIIQYAWLLQFAVAAIGLLIAMTASMNTMLMSTYERIKEFATLRAIGASRFTVLAMILFESLILSLTGGVAGIIMGLMGSQLLDTALTTFFQLSFPLARITLRLVMEGLALSAFVGFVGALLPSIIVYRMTIINALRWE